MRTPAISTLFVVLLLNAAALAQSTAFTYQGRLKNGTALAAGTHDFRFRLWDAASGGAQLGSTQCVDNLAVSEGLFTATIDFGQQFTSPNQRFLEIEVRADTGLTCANAGGFVVLAPRQLLTAAPLAQHAKSAFSLDAADGSPANAVFVDNSGNVGIGTASPATRMHIAGAASEGVRLQGNANGPANLAWMAFHDLSGAPIGYVGDGGVADANTYLGSDVADVVLQTPGGAVLTATSAGRVGIGTSTPGGKLDIQGSNGSNILFGRRTGGGLAHNLYIDSAGNGSMQMLDSTGTPRVEFANGLTHFSYGNVGIGTSSPLAKLDVRGDIRLGPSGQYFAAAGHENLRIIRGTVDPGTSCSDTPTTSGLGFTITVLSCGEIRVNFTTPFSGTPVVVASAEWDFNNGSRYVTCSDVTTSSAAMRAFFANGNNTRARFRFMAVGPR